MKIAYQFNGMKMEKVIQNKPNSSCAPNCIWDSSKDFLDKFKEGISYDKIKELRRKEFLNTIELVNNGFYLTENGKKVAIKETGKIVSETKFYSHKFDVKDIPTIIGETKIDVINSDCLEEGIKLLDAGYNPAILNMANRQNPGGGVRNGAGAQEETIFRRTNIFRSLYQFTAYAEQYGIHKSPY